MNGLPERSVLPNQPARNGEACKEKIRLLDAFSEAMTEYARVHNESSTLPKDERTTVLKNVHGEYERAKLALRLHRKEHGC